MSFEIREITVIKYEDEKLDVEGFEGELFEDVKWVQQNGLEITPKVGSKGLAVALGGDADRLTVIALDAHADGEPVSLYDSRGNKVVLGDSGIEVISNSLVKVTAPEAEFSGNVTITGNLKVSGSTDLAVTKINGVTQVGN